MPKCGRCAYPAALGSGVACRARHLDRVAGLTYTSADLDHGGCPISTGFRATNSSRKRPGSVDVTIGAVGFQQRISMAARRRRPGGVTRPAMSRLRKRRNRYSTTGSRFGHWAWRGLALRTGPYRRRWRPAGQRLPAPSAMRSCRHRRQTCWAPTPISRARWRLTRPARSPFATSSSRRNSWIASGGVALSGDGELAGDI